MYHIKSWKACVIILLITCVWYNTNFIRDVFRTKFANITVQGGNRSDGERLSSTFRGGNTSSGNGDLQQDSLGIPTFINLPKQVSLLLETDEEIEKLSKEISILNARQKIYNLDKFGPVNENTSVIVIQVHSRTKYLNFLVDSLSRMRGIENSLMIFSHDLYLPRLNEAIRNLDFTRVMQIFYPQSIQLNPRHFPGPSKDDCPRDISLAKAKEIKCINAEFPDIHGHYREASFAQLKHHWWWKANFVFGKLDVLKNYNGVIAFLEEDHYVTPDFLWMLKLMESAMIQNLCNGCSLLSLGSYLSSWNIQSFHSRAVATVTNWDAPKHNNMGVTFNRTLWKKVQDCAQTFCDYDDYNWDWTLHHIANTCLRTKLDILYAEAPRIFHIGDCGVHHKRTTCEPEKAVLAIEKGIKQYKSILFPDELTIKLRQGMEMRLQNANGGFGDIRDRKLCLSFAESPPTPLEESFSFAKFFKETKLGT